MKSPFKFLDSYTKEDRDIFFGREREIEELYHRVFESKIMLVYGISGTGKSSLIHCGLANKFQETDWLPLVIRRGGNILENLAAAIKAASITPQTGEIITPLHFKKAIRSLYLDHYKPVFFIFDQFEELFIFGNKDEKRSFIQAIKTIVESEIQCRFIFVMREEYMASFTEFERFIPSIFQNRVRIEKMSHVNALDAIKGPCKVFNISLEEGFAETLLEKLSPESADVELTYLQVFLDKIFKLATVEKTENDVHNSFTLSLLKQTGDVSDLLGSFLDEQISLLGDPDTGLAVLKSFVSVKGTKQPMKVEEVRDYVMTLGRKPDEKSLAEMIQSFVSLRILCDKDQRERYELRHDALAAKIYEKFTLVEKELLEVRKFVENAYYSFETRGLLMSKDDLDYLTGYENKLILPQNLSDFVNQSRQKLFSQKRALKRITSWSALIFVLLLLAVGRYYLRSQQAVKDKDQLGLALIESEINPVKGLFTYLSLWENDSTSTQLQHLILNSFQNVINLRSDSVTSLSNLQDYLRPIQMEASIENAGISRNGKYLFGWLQNNSVFIVNIESNNKRSFKTDGQICHIEMSIKDSLVAVIFKINKIKIYDFNGNEICSIETSINDILNDKLFRFFPSGSFFAAIAKGNDAYIINKSGKSEFQLSGHTNRINSLDISPDGKFIVTASDDHRAFIWNYNVTTKRFGIYDSLISHKNVVWSCRFNKTGKYIITASADSNIKIWNLNGEQINPEFTFIKIGGGGNRVRKNNGEPDDDASNPVYSQYYGSFCDAEFTSSEREILATGYTMKKDSSGLVTPHFYRVIFNDGAGKFYRGSGTVFYSIEDGNNTLITANSKDLTLSNDERNAAVTNELSNRIAVFSGDGSKILTLSGSRPVFSPEGTDLFWTEGRFLHRLPVSPNKIKSLLNNFNILPRTESQTNEFIRY